MTCRHIDVGPGGFAIVCSRGSARSRCSIDGCTKPSTKLCDFPLSGSKAGKTCDRRLCDSHARAQGDSVDFCPTHAEMAERDTKATGQRGGVR